MENKERIQKINELKKALEENSKKASELSKKSWQLLAELQKLNAQK